MIRGAASLAIAFRVQRIFSLLIDIQLAYIRGLLPDQINEVLDASEEESSAAVMCKPHPAEQTRDKTTIALLAKRPKTDARLTTFQGTRSSRLLTHERVEGW